MKYSLPIAYWIYWFIAGVLWGGGGFIIGQMIYGRAAIFGAASAILVSIYFGNYIANSDPPGCGRTVALGIAYYYLGVLVFSFTSTMIICAFPWMGQCPVNTLGITQPDLLAMLFLPLIGASYLGAGLIPLAIVTVRLSDILKFAPNLRQL